MPLLPSGKSTTSNYYISGKSYKRLIDENFPLLIIDVIFMELALVYAVTESLIEFLYFKSEKQIVVINHGNYV